MQEVLFLLCSHMLLPPHGLHDLRARPCSQIPFPPQSLHMYLIRPWRQMSFPPQFLHRLFTLPWSQIALPPHLVHLLRTIPCLHKPLPPHSLHRCLFLECLHTAEAPQSIHVDLYRPCGHSGLPCIGLGGWMKQPRSRWRFPFRSCPRFRMPRVPLHPHHLGCMQKEHLNLRFAKTSDTESSVNLCALEEFL